MIDMPILTAANKAISMFIKNEKKGFASTIVYETNDTVVRRSIALTTKKPRPINTMTATTTIINSPMFLFYLIIT